MQRILLAYDGTDAARTALDTAATFATTFGASITVVSVVPVHPGRSPMDPWDDRDTHAQELREAAGLLRERDVTFDLIEPLGDVPRTIERSPTRATTTSSSSGRATSVRWSGCSRAASPSISPPTPPRPSSWRADGRPSAGRSDPRQRCRPAL